ncbi:PREDICTED: uncharacterized protein LOC104591655 isoform X2 [Nelumbo nucifera]|uniref:Uncharacterized protein LOC104591655 isoform X2 n=1 Tax=Nelumbo nucifera TaxID=4432 RepID=A0A1U7Z6G4_NELNU|nr:PREDICTED: uncharacterized protein LOC104591655 isoform X2 [Nelumbo nucifera]
MAILRSFGRLYGFYSFRTRTRICPYEHVTRRNLSDSNKNINGDSEVLPVLIVGAGPVGLVLSILLTKLGVKCAILEKNRTFSQHPQAHFINNRSMEVFRKLDGLAEEIQRLQPPVDLWRKFIYCTSLSGSVLGSVDHMQPEDFEQVVSPVSVAHFSQYKLTRLLVKQLEKLGFCVCDSDGLETIDYGTLRAGEILMGHECVSIKYNDSCITVGACFVKEGKKIERNINCTILIGSDGAGSTVRKLMGIEMRGERDLQNLVSIHFFSQNLGHYLLHDRPGMLFFIFNTDAIGVLVAHDLNQGEFVLQVPFYPPQQNIKDFSFEVCKELILKLVGQNLVDIDVVDIKPWVMHAEVAEEFVSGGNRIILAGDAAHRFPPAGGFGMNTGIQDAHNLAWKIACLVKGIAPPSILRTYEMERRPIAIFNTALSVQNFKAAMSVPSALGLDPTVANKVHQIINSEVGSILPSGLQRALLNGIFTIGRAQLSEYILSERNPLGSSRLVKLQRIFDEGKSLQLQFPTEDLGFRYLQGALVPDSDKVPNALKETPTGLRRNFIPSAEPGSRLPHMTVKVLQKLSNKETFSTLDLVSGNKIEFLLIVAPKKQSYDLARAAFKVAKEFKVSLKVCVIWPHRVAEKMDGSRAALIPNTNYIDVEEVWRSSSSLSWWGICQVTDRGAILVRPDEHIAWRAKSEVLGDHVLEMEKVFSLVLAIKKTRV